VKNASHSGPGIGHEAGKATNHATRIVGMVKTNGEDPGWNVLNFDGNLITGRLLFFLLEICISNKMMNDL